MLNCNVYAPITPYMLNGALHYSSLDLIFFCCLPRYAAAWLSAHYHLCFLIRPN